MSDLYPTCSTCMEDLIPNDGELCGACVKSERAAAEERGRRAGIEAMKLGTCRVYIHGCADGRAASEARPNWREHALPHPKRDNCTDWEALAPRDSGKEG